VLGFQGKFLSQIEEREMDYCRHRFMEAYRIMGEKFDDEYTRQNARQMAVDLDKEDANRTFNLGCSSGTTARARAFGVEAMRQLARGSSGDLNAICLMEMAIQEIERVRGR
jgi:hypothetical protein